MTKKYLKDLMKKMSVLPAILIVALVGLASCGPDDDPDAVSVSMTSLTLSTTGGSQSIQVTSNTKWTVSGAPGWLIVSPMQGSNNGAFTVTAEANKDKSSRNCTLMINAGSASAVVSVFQSGKNSEPTDELSGSYTGTLKPMGFADEPARCYVTLTKLSKDAVRLEKLICEQFGLDMEPINLTVKEESDGRITLRSETSKSVEGSYFQGQLTLSFSNSLATFYFSGTKN
ncbi:MAG: BACON domain-containing protein [Prevotella sp.]|nr:BACON domain-containing protein [Prevotella sp.]